jgi:sporulation protein YlmC with PRC-barrel domain
MKKRLFLMAAVAFFAFVSFVTGAHAQMLTSGWDTHEVRQLFNYGVKNQSGEYLGRIQDFVVDSNGRITFAIISQPGFLGIRGKAVAVPFEALSFGSEKQEFVLDMSREMFASAPQFDKKADLGNRTWAEGVYRYFGIQPYWTEGGGGSTMEPMKHGQEMEDSPSYEYDD